MGRLVSWTENVPDGAEPVQFVISDPDDWGCQAYSFTMPARDVAVHGVWETIYSVVYEDGVEGEELFEEWHMVAEGEPTPAFSNGATPTREGDTFARWTPNVADYVYSDAYYYALWNDEGETCAHKDWDYGEREYYVAAGELVDNGDETHTGLIHTYADAWCNDCDASFGRIRISARPTKRTLYHKYVDGVCECGHGSENDSTCGHPLFLITYYYKPVDGFKDNGDGTHTGMAYKWAREYCEYCAQYTGTESVEYEVQIDEEPVEYTLPHTWSGGKCSACGYVCEHEYGEEERVYYE